MLAVHLTCPRCTRHLRCNQLIAVGKRLRCPHCGARFRAGLDDPGIARAPSPPSSHGHGILLAGCFSPVSFCSWPPVLPGRVGRRPRTAARFADGCGEEGPPPILEQPPLRERADRDAASTAAPRESHSLLASPLGLPIRCRIRRPPDHTPPPLPEPPRSNPSSSRSRQGKGRMSAETENTPRSHAWPEDAPQIHWLPARFSLASIERSITASSFCDASNAPTAVGGIRPASGTRPVITALSALTLLECGVKANDPQVQVAAKYCVGECRTLPPPTRSPWRSCFSTA